ncbi:alkaline phosphatase-like protein [Anaeromyces robustus]|uniref:Alkaline phosphatase n=1 Tax=Anaeromyces robustus TaxID=1754192 RepID=A0A1Y1X0B3_9FUNG|nr:alkaline phosphatase-like protein [Anaeromyces robustus]|eukprot:ORX78876.1 alkaline phosphatase-like protein [Anaeromyces robustus]
MNNIFKKSTKPFNIIFMISDGFGPTSETFGRTYYQHINNYSYDHLTPLDKILVGQSRTRSHNSLITDSAAGATAFSCGLKTFNYGVAVDPNSRPCATLLEGAHDKGMLTGIVVTSRITHATPAAFLGHAINRNEEDFIASWLAPNITNAKYDRQVDLLFGGGLCHFIPSYENDSCRQDDVNLLEDTEYFFINDRASFDRLNDTGVLPVMGLFTPDHMSFEIDRDPKKEPALWEMAEKALRILSKSDKNKKGFFLMIEGSRIDMAAHGNDPAAHANDILAYYKTVEIVQKFVDENPNTLLVSVSDHETGGLALGYQPTKVYPKYIWHPEVILNVKKSTNKVALEIEKILKSGNNNNDEEEDDDSNTVYDLTTNIIYEKMGIDDVTEEELKFIVESDVGRQTMELANYLAKMVSHRAKIAWTTHGHSGADVNLYAYGKNAELFRGSKENNEIGRIIEKLLGIDLNKLTKRLFSNYEFPKKNVTTKVSKPKFKEIHYHMN